MILVVLEYHAGDKPVDYDDPASLAESRRFDDLPCAVQSACGLETVYVGVVAHGPDVLAAALALADEVPAWHTELGFLHYYDAETGVGLNNVHDSWESVGALTY